jgi:hypothetical protein
MAQERFENDYVPEDSVQGTPKGGILVSLGQVLMCIQIVALFGGLAEYGLVRNDSVSNLLRDPSPEALGGTIGYLLGWNLPALFGLALSLVACVRFKNPRGKTTALIAGIIILLNSALAFIGKDPNTVSSQRTSDGRHARDSGTIKYRSNAETEEDAGELSKAIGKMSLENVRTEMVDALKSGIVTFTSTRDGFSVRMPASPTMTAFDISGQVNVGTTRLYQTTANSQPVAYNVFVHIFEQKILSDEAIQAYLDSTTVGRLVMVEKGRLVSRIPTKFRGFEAMRFEHTSEKEGVEFVHKGVVFVIDGDSISLTMVHPNNITPELTLDAFLDSFELIPLEPVLREESWIDMVSGLQFKPPADMLERERTQRTNGLIVTFVNKAGHSMSVFDVSALHPNLTLADVRRELATTQADGDGHYKNVFITPGSETPIVQLMNYIVNEGRIYMIQGCAPQETYFRSERKFKEAIKSLAFTK